MVAAAEIVGEKFAYLTVNSRAGSRRNAALWLCDCDCGNSRLATTIELRSGHTKSCGCQHGNPSHGHTRGGKSLTYNSYTAMLGRCTQPSNPAFAHYAKKGIRVCDRWRHGENGRSGFECFLADMGERPSHGHTLDRHPDNDGHYEPGNVRWATRREQANNRETNVHFDYQGERVTFAELVRRTGMPKELLRHRLLRAHWPLEAALNTPPSPGMRKHPF